jgi:hypothetical protein
LAARFAGTPLQVVWGAESGSPQSSPSWSRQWVTNTRPLSATPLQSLSAPSHTSGLPGKFWSSASSQSVHSDTPSPSASGVSSVSASQSLSSPSQVASVSPGFTAARRSSQSRLFATVPTGGRQALTGAAPESPYPSPSSSG